MNRKERKSPVLTFYIGSHAPYHGRRPSSAHLYKLNDAIGDRAAADDELDDALPIGGVRPACHVASVTGDIVDDDDTSASESADETAVFVADDDDGGGHQHHDVYVAL